MKKLSVMQMVWGVILILFGAVGAGWGAQTYLSGTYATRGELQLAGGKVDILFDARLEQLIEQRARLQAKKVKTPEDLRQIDYLNKQIDHARNVQSGKVK